MRAHARYGPGELLAIIDEEPSSSRWLRGVLETAGYRCLQFDGYFKSRFDAAAVGLSAIVLDLAPPALDRLGTIRSIRGESEVPILVVTERADEQDKIAALDTGADDYVIKPLGPGEFLARVRVALRHGSARRGTPGGRVQLGELAIDLLSREVTLFGERLAFTPTDYKLLALLARNVGRVVPHEQLLHEAWGPNARDPHYLRVYMARLRRKLDPDRAGTRYIVTEAGVGYRLLATPKP
ncbi:MAG TPA: response regulator transcription factor [Polyangiaceae bacterium]|nr:response regulator transcription factor [Polyangiaceae bacterium]